jgi:AsmA protein
MKFNIKWALAVVVVVLVGLAAAPWTVSQNAQIAAIETQIKAGSGLRLVSHGRSVFAVLPRPHIRIYDARLEQGGGALTLSTSSLRVDLGLAGLATGQLSLARAVLADAVFTLDSARAPSLTTAAGAKPPRGAPGAQQGGSGKTSGQDLGQNLGQGLGEVQVSNGKVLLRRAGAENPEIVADDIDARLEWSGASAPLSLVGHCLLPAMGEDRGPARFALWAAQPDKWTRGDASAITLHIEDGAFLLNLNGALALTPFPHFLGQIDGAAPSLRVAALWLGLPLPLPGPYRDATLKGEASLDPNLLSFPSLSISVDGNALDGAASVRLDGQRPQIAATLAGASVNLAPMAEDWPAMTAGGQWSHDSFPASHLSAADVDLRLSANHVRLGDFQADAAALSAILKNGRLDLSLAEASAYSGQVRARAIIAESGAGFDLRGSVSAEKIDVAALLWDGFKRQALTGVGRGALTFETSGYSYYELASHLDGRGDLSVDNGEIYGLDLSLAFRRMERRPLTAGVELRSGRTSFTTLATKFSIVQGVAEIEEGVARDDRMTTYFSGRAQIAERTLDLHAAASRPSASGADATSLQLGFSISGGWDDATVVPDALSLINRSDAAAPLLPKGALPQ